MIRKPQCMKHATQEQRTDITLTTAMTCKQIFFKRCAHPAIARYRRPKQSTYTTSGKMSSEQPLKTSKPQNASHSVPLDLVVQSAVIRSSTTGAPTRKQLKWIATHNIPTLINKCPTPYPAPQYVGSLHSSLQQAPIHG